MSQASEQIAKQYANAAINKKNWGDIAYNALVEGLSGDGVSDDTAKLQALINKAIAADRRTILFPHGQYYVTALTNADQVDFVGDNSSFVGGYTGTISDLGGLAALEADYAKEVGAVYNVKGYGVKGDGLNDDTAAIQAAINAAAVNGGGKVFFPAGKYVLTSTILITQPIYIVGDGKGDNTTNTNGSGVGLTTFTWNGAPGGTMFHFKSAIANEYLFGGGMKNFLIDGATLAGTGFRGSSIGYMEFSAIEGRNFRVQMGLIDAENGVLAQFNKFEDIHFVYGSSVAVENASGLAFIGNTLAGVTQNHIVSITGLVSKGSLLYFAWSDNNIIEKAHGFATSTGYTVYLANGVGGNADNNYFQYVVGKIYAMSNTYGNRFGHIISEGGGISVDAGAQLHYEAVDYVNAELFTTHKYVMSDQKDIPIGSFTVIDGGAVTSMAALQWSCLSLPDAVDSRIGVSVTPPYSWNKGNLSSIRIFFTTDTANTSKQWRCRFKAMTAVNNSNITTPEVDSFANIPVADAPYTVKSYDLPLALAYAKDDLLFFSIQRIGADALDTALGNIQILGVSLIYQGTGPDSAGSGTWAVTPPYK